MSISTVNPYLNHPQLSSIEQQVLWEYAKLGDKTKRIASLARDTSASPNEPLLAELRELERKMGLVLTLFKGSVWAVLMDSKAKEEAQRYAQSAADADADQYEDDSLERSR